MNSFRFWLSVLIMPVCNSQVIIFWSLNSFEQFCYLFLATLVLYQNWILKYI